MADLTHDASSMTDEGFHEIQLSGKQLVFLFMTAALLLAVVFLLGVQVGRGVKSDRSADTTTAEALTSATPAAAATPAPSAATSAPAPADAPAPVQEPEDELSYAKRLQGDKAPAEKLKSAASPGAKTTEDKAAHAAPKVAAPAQAAPSASPATAAPASTGQAGAWVVQLVALKDRSDAAAMATRLSSKGYPAFVLDPAAGAPVIYRVQVGGYPDRDQADQAARRIEREEKIQGYVRSR